MNLAELVPLLTFEEAVWDTKQVLPANPVTVQPGQAYQIFRYDRSGYAVAFGATFSSPAMILRMRYFSLGGVERVMQGSPAQLQAGGLTVWNAGGWWSPPASNSMYFHPPAGMWTGWQNLCILEVFNPTIAAQTIQQMTSVALLIQDLNKFAEKIRWLNGAEAK
jgi:hypothetical protein